MPVGFTVDEQSYYYKKNAQGDIVAILDSEGVELASYTYDACGNITTVSGDEQLAENNPFRYRGYYQDSESGFFYLQSRYYDSSVGRFLNADSQINEGILGYNLFAYCGNNSINNWDPIGYSYYNLYLQPSWINALAPALAGIVAGISASLASIKTAILTSWIPIVAIAAIGIAIVGVVYVVNKAASLIASAQRTISAVKAKIQEGGYRGKLGSHTVYVIYPKNTLDVVYVGRTINYNSRKYNHQEKPNARFPQSTYNMRPIASNLTLAQARALERTIINAYTLIALSNSINSIAQGNLAKFTKEFEQIKSLVDAFYTED